MKYCITILLSIYTSCVAASLDIRKVKKDIEAYIEESRDRECWDPGYIAHLEKSEIAEERYFFVIYGYPIGPCRDRNGW